MVELESKERMPKEENHSFSSSEIRLHNWFLLFDLAKQALEREK